MTCDPGGKNHRTGRLYLAGWPHVEDGQNIGGGAHASDDGGQTWEPVIDPGKHACTVTVDPANPGMLYMTTFGSPVWYGPAADRDARQP